MNCLTIIKAIRQQMNMPRPFVVALDGGSGSGKSTLADCIAHELNIAIIPCDDFYAAHIPDAEWVKRSPAELVRDAIDWQRLRDEALNPLLAGQIARWRTFDFEAGTLDDGTYGMKPDLTERQPAPIIILDGIYSARPELADFVDLSVLVDVPIEQRHARLDLREDADFLNTWHERWDGAEVHYFTEVKPHDTFDLIVNND